MEHTGTRGPRDLSVGSLECQSRPHMFGKGGQGPTAQAKPTSCWVASLGVTSGIQGVPQSTRIKTGVCLHEGKSLGPTQCNGVSDCQ